MSAGVDAAAGSSADAATILRVRGLTKHFGGTLAVDKVDFELLEGDIHALLGENGAGKSTVIKVLAGVYEADAGEIYFADERVHPSSQRLPIACIHQDLALFESMTVAENIGIVDGYPRPHGVISWRRLADQAREALGIVGSDIDPVLPVSALSAAEKSIVAIVRALAQRTAQVLILDEPTASLPQPDVERLFDALRLLRRQGVAMLYVTHRLDEVFRIADRVTVLRDGRRIATTDTGRTTRSELVFQIVGRPPAEVFTTPAAPSVEAVLDLRGLQAADAGPVSLSLAAGEIVALVGLRGAGHDSIGRALFGDERIVAGSIGLGGKNVRPRGPGSAIRLGIGFVPGQRVEGLAQTLNVRENLFLNPLVSGRGLLRPALRRRERKRAYALLEEFDVRPRDPERLMNSLSGGNQQKVVLARWAGTRSRLLVLEDPTIGVDVGAKAEIYGMLTELVEGGGSIILVSSDFEEVAGVAHRAFVFHRGRVIAELSRDQLSVATLTHLAAGGRSE